MAHPTGEPSVQWKINVPVPIAAIVEHRIMDTHTQKPTYGARSRLITALLKRYISETGGGAVNSPRWTEADIEALERQSEVR